MAGSITTWSWTPEAQRQSVNGGFCGQERKRVLTDLDLVVEEDAWTERKHTYFSSAVWAAMRVRRDLSARGQPDRLEDEEKNQKTRVRTELSQNQNQD